MHESEKWKWSHSVVSDSQQPHGLQPTRLLRPWEFPGKSTGVGCPLLLGIHSTAIAKTSTSMFLSYSVTITKCFQLCPGVSRCLVAQSRPTLCNSMGWSTPGFPVLHYLPELAQTHDHWSVMPSNHLIFCRPRVLFPSIFPSIWIFFNESSLFLPPVFLSRFHWAPALKILLTSPVSSSCTPSTPYNCVSLTPRTQQEPTGMWMAVAGERLTPDPGGSRCRAWYHPKSSG